MILTSTRARTAPVAIMSFMEVEGMLEWSVIASLGMFTLLPMIIFILLARRFIERGITLGAVKG
jgi:multiple sugar transport system permease protein